MSVVRVERYGTVARLLLDSPSNRNALSAQLRTELHSGLVEAIAPFNPHGGSLAEGATQGSGHVREAAHQLQGRAGARQVADAQRALVTAGGYFFNAQGLALHRA